MVKWGLVFTTLPLVAVVLMAKVLLSNALHLDVPIEFSDIAVVLTGGFTARYPATGTEPRR